MAKQPCSCTRPLLRLREWDNSTLRLLDVGNQSHSTLKTSSTSAWRTPSGTSWSGEDEGPSEKLHMVARNRQGNWGNREDLLGLSANAGWTYYRTMGMTITTLTANPYWFCLTFPRLDFFSWLSWMPILDGWKWKKWTPRSPRKPLRNYRAYFLGMVCHPSKWVTMGHSLYLKSFICSSREMESNIWHLHHTTLPAIV